MNHLGNGIKGLVFVAVLALFSAFAFFLGKEYGQVETVAVPEDVQLSRMLVSVNAFKSMAQTNYADAFLLFSKGQGMEKLHEMDKNSWTVPQSQAGWTLFFNAAIQVHADKTGKSPLIGFYNPYSDLFLIGVWESDDGLYQMTDAELLLGDWLRVDNKELDIAAQWLRGPAYRPQALAQSVAETILSFEQVFASVTRADWRSKLAILTDSFLQEGFNSPIATIRLQQQFENVTAFANAEPGHALVARFRNATIDVIDEIVGQGIESVLATADETVTNTAEVLQAASPEWFDELRVAAVVTDEMTGLVFLAPTKQTRVSLVFRFEGGASARHIKRFDLIDYQYGYEMVAKTRQHGGGK